MSSRTFTFTLGAVVLASAVSAQVPTGTISGQVTSADGLSLPGVTVP